MIEGTIFVTKIKKVRQTFSLYHRKGYNGIRRVYHETKSDEATLFSLLILVSLGKSLALTNEEVSPLLKELIETEFRILEIREAPPEGFWEVVTEIGQEKIIFYIHKNLRFIVHGQILDRQIKRNITLDRLRDFRRVDSLFIDAEKFHLLTNCPL